MNSFESILVVTDFSEASHRALRRACLLAMRQRARLTLLHVFDPSASRPLRGWFARRSEHDSQSQLAPLRATMTRWIDEIAARHGIDVQPELRIGDALAEVHRAAQSASLVVIGAARANPLRDLILSTPAERLLRTLKRPVLVVRHPAAAAYRSVLVPVELDGAHAEIALGAAAELAPTAALHLLHATQLPWESRLRTSGVSEALIERQREAVRARGVRSLQAVARSQSHRRVAVSVGHGDAARLALQRQHALDADLIVLGKSGRSTLAEFLMGSVAQRVLAEARSDVLVIPNATLARLGEARSARLQAGAGSDDWASTWWTGRRGARSGA